MISQLRQRYFQSITYHTFIVPSKGFNNRRGILSSTQAQILCVRYQHQLYGRCRKVTAPIVIIVVAMGYESELASVTPLLETKYIIPFWTYPPDFGFGFFLDCRNLKWSERVGLRATAVCEACKTEEV